MNHFKHQTRKSLRVSETGSSRWLAYAAFIVPSWLALTFPIVTSWNVAFAQPLPSPPPDCGLNNQCKDEPDPCPMGPTVPDTNTYCCSEPNPTLLKNYTGYWKRCSGVYKPYCHFTNNMPGGTCGSEFPRQCY